MGEGHVKLMAMIRAILGADSLPYIVLALNQPDPGSRHEIRTSATVASEE